MFYGEECTMENLTIIKPRKDILKTYLGLALGKFISKSIQYYRLYEMMNDPIYNFHKDRLDIEKTNQLNQRFSVGAQKYKAEQLNSSDIELLSEYYHYSLLEKNKQISGLKICNIGCFYCLAETTFLNKYPQNDIYALDFGNLHEINKDLSHEGLHLLPGYPLETLEKFIKEGKNNFFDHTFFSRCATVINIEQLLTYMKCIQHLSKNVSFLEVVKTNVITQRVVDVARIDLMKPIRLYSGMYIHNYVELLTKFNYNIKEGYIFHAQAFKQTFSPDHYFVYIFGEKK